MSLNRDSFLSVDDEPRILTETNFSFTPKYFGHDNFSSFDLSTSRRPSVLQSVRDLKHSYSMPYGMTEFCGPPRLPNFDRSSIYADSLAKNGNLSKRSNESKSSSTLNEKDCFLECLTRSTARNATCLLSILFSIFLLFTGLNYYRKCPVEGSIPVFLILGGSIFLVLSLGYILLESSENGLHMKHPKILRACHKIISTLFAIWFVLGNVVVIFKHKTTDFRVLPVLVLEGCDPVVYFVAYGLLMCCYFLVALIFVLILLITIAKKVAHYFSILLKRASCWKRPKNKCKARLCKINQELKLNCSPHEVQTFTNIKTNFCEGYSNKLDRNWQLLVPQSNVTRSHYYSVSNNCDSPVRAANQTTSVSQFSSNQIEMPSPSLLKASKMNKYIQNEESQL